MKRLLSAAFILGLCGASTLFAQWAAFPTKNVPKNAAGQPDLTGPAPKTADGKPDLSGIWQNGGGGGGGGGRGAAGGGGGRGGAAAAPAAPATPAANVAPPNANFGNAGAGFPGGKLPYQPWAEELMNKRKADNSKDNPDAHCLPMGFMQFHTHPEPRKIVQTPDMILIIYEANSGLRQIFMDGRPLPGPDVEPWWYGYSVGKWEGDTLVVETRHIKDGEWLDVQGSPLTPEAKVTERFRRPNFGTLQIDVTVDDPKAYKQPWTVRVNQRALLNTELIEFICEDRDATHYVGAEGKK